MKKKREKMQRDGGRERDREGGREGEGKGGEGEETKILAGSVKDGGMQLSFHSDIQKCLTQCFSVFTVYAIRSASLHWSQNAPLQRRTPEPDAFKRNYDIQLLHFGIVDHFFNRAWAVWFIWRWSRFVFALFVWDDRHIKCLVNWLCAAASDA